MKHPNFIGSVFYVDTLQMFKFVGELIVESQCLYQTLVAHAHNSITHHGGQVQRT